MSTPVGHSRLQPLHEMHSVIVSRISSETSASGPSWPDNARRRVLARPRVRCCSSLVAGNEGHMTPPSRVRQAPLLLHISTAVEMCNNNGACRTRDGGVMCPSFPATSDEQHLTRGRASTLRLALSGQLGPDA